MDVLDLTCWWLQTTSDVRGALLCGSMSVSPALAGTCSVSPYLLGEVTVTPLLTGEVELDCECGTC